MNVTILLCDYATVAEGKLFISGGGWDLLRPIAGPTALAILVKVAWGETNRRTQLRIRLVDEDGRAVTQMGPSNLPAPVEVRVDFEVGRPPGIAHGTDVSMPMAIPVGPLVLQPDRGYEWRIEKGDETIGSAPFRTFADQPSPPQS